MAVATLVSGLLALGSAAAQGSTTNATVSINTVSRTNHSTGGGITIEEAGYWALDTHTCKAWKSYNWDYAQYVCHYRHDTKYGSYYNIFVEQWDRVMFYECGCTRGLESYDPWGSRWTRSSSGGVTCVSRDGKQAWEIARDHFTTVNCPEVKAYYFAPQPTQHH